MEKVIFLRSLNSSFLIQLEAELLPAIKSVSPVMDDTDIGITKRRMANSNANSFGINNIGS